MTFKSAFGPHYVKEEEVLRVEEILPGHIPVFGTDGKMRDGGPLPTGSGNTYISTSYSALSTLKSSNQLAPGTLYKISHQTKHVIPYTSVLNINSSDYVAAPEDILLLAIAANKFDKRVYSANYPQDIIFYDFDNITCEDNTTSREGKIFYRKDSIKNNETWYDFRNVLFRRALINATTIPDFTSGNTYYRGDLVKQSGVIYKALKDLPSVSTLINDEWVPIGTSAYTSTKWAWASSFTLANSSFVWDTSTYSDVLTFDNTQTNVSIGLTTANNGYNNIVFTSSCTNVTIEGGCQDMSLRTLNNTRIGAGSINLYVIGSSDISLHKTVGSYIEGMTEMIANGIVSQDIHFYGDKVNLGHDSSNNYFKHPQKVTTGSSCSNNSIFALLHSTLEHGCIGNHFVMTEKITMGHDCSYNSIYSTRYMTMEPNCDNNKLSGNGYGNNYNMYYSAGCNNIISDGTLNSVSFGLKASYIQILNSSTLNVVSFGANCNSIIINNNSYMSDVMFGANCNSINVLDSDFYDTQFNPECGTMTFNTNCYINNAVFGTGCYNFILEASSSIQNTTIGPSCTGFYLTTTSSIQNSFFEGGNFNITVTSSLYNCTFSSGVGDKTFQFGAYGLNYQYKDSSSETFTGPYTPNGVTIIASKNYTGKLITIDSYGGIIALDTTYNSISGTSGTAGLNVLSMNCENKHIKNFLATVGSNTMIVLYNTLEGGMYEVNLTKTTLSPVSVYVDSQEIPLSNGNNSEYNILFKNSRFTSGLKLTGTMNAL